MSLMTVNHVCDSHRVTCCSFVPLTQSWGHDTLKIMAQNHHCCVGASSFFNFPPHTSSSSSSSLFYSHPPQCVYYISLNIHVSRRTSCLGQKISMSPHLFQLLMLLTVVLLVLFSSLMTDTHSYIYFCNCLFISSSFLQGFNFLQGFLLHLFTRVLVYTRW